MSRLAVDAPWSGRGLGAGQLRCSRRDAWPPPATPRRRQSLDRFLAASVPVLHEGPGRRSASTRASPSPIADRDGKLSLAEVQAIQGEVDWLGQGEWPTGCRRRSATALVVGLLRASRPSGRNSCSRATTPTATVLLTREELTADIRLDKRPLPEILSDPSSIDWNALAARAGDAAPLLRQLFQL